MAYCVWFSSSWRFVSLSGRSSRIILCIYPIRTHVYIYVCMYGCVLNIYTNLFPTSSFLSCPGCLILTPFFFSTIYCRSVPLQAPNICTTTLGNSVTIYEGTAPCQHRHIDKYKKCARLYWDLLPRILGPLDPGFLLILLTILVSSIKIGARLNGSSVNIFEAAPPAGKGRKRSRISWSRSLHFQDFVCVCVWLCT